jgi:hypothetical protein
MHEFNQAVLGGYSLGKFAGLFFWALVGAYVLIQIHNNSRNPASSRTPVAFSWSFWFRDNARRVVFNLVLILVAIRFSQDLISLLNKAGISTGGATEINEFWAFVIGLSSDLLAQGANKLRLINLIGTAFINAKDAEKDAEKLSKPDDPAAGINGKEGPK